MQCLFFHVAGYLYVSLLVYSGLRNPEWQISSNTYFYQEIVSHLPQAKNQGNVYHYLCIPPKTGYKGFLVLNRRQLIVGPEKKTLQLLLLDTMPSGLPTVFRQRIRNVIDSGFVTKECPERRKRYAPPYNPDRWNSREHRIECNNCYNYANTLITNTYVQPGLGSGQMFGAITNQEVKNAAIRDGLLVWNHPDLTTVPGPPNGERHLVALFVAPGRYYFLNVRQPIWRYYKL